MSVTLILVTTIVYIMMGWTTAFFSCKDDGVDDSDRGIIAFIVLFWPIIVGLLFIVFTFAWFPIYLIKKYQERKNS